MENVVKRQIVWGDLDALGIVFYPRYYEWIDACGHLFFDKVGVNLGRLWSDRGIQFGLIETGCRYQLPGRYGQQIRIVTKIGELTKKTIRLSHQIFDRDKDQLMVNGLEKRICMDVSDPERFFARKIPEDIFRLLQHAAA